MMEYDIGLESKTLSSFFQVGNAHMPLNLLIDYII